MCTSNCGGICSLALKQEEINSKAALTEVVRMLDNITVCSSTHKNGDTQKTELMNTLTQLKTEAGSLLADVNRYSEASSENTVFRGEAYDFEKAFEEIAFKEKLQQLKEKISTLEISIKKE